MASDRIRTDLEKRLWKAGLTTSRHPEHRHWLGVAEYPQWLFRCYQTRQWFLWHLFDDARAESPDPSSYFALITVDRRDDSEVATFDLALLEAWLNDEKPFVIPRRKRRVGFAHHSLMQEISTDDNIPMLASCETNHTILISVPLSTFKQWLDGFPERVNTESAQQQIGFSLWTSDVGEREG